MKLVNSELNLCLDIGENDIIELVVEDTYIFYNVVRDLYNQINGREGDFVLSDDKKVSLDKNSEIIIDFFSLSVNNKKIINKLYAACQNIADDYAVETNTINSQIVSMLDRITTSLGNAELNFNLDLNWVDIFKIYQLEFAEEYETLAQKMVSYIKILSDFTDIKLLFVVNAKAYLGGEELKQIYQMCEYCKVALFMIEPQESVERTKEIRYIIDKDKCIIDAN